MFYTPRTCPLTKGDRRMSDEVRTELTDRQRQALDQVRAVIRQTGIPPTVRELAGELGIKSSSAHALLKALEGKGFLRRAGSRARSLTLQDPSGSASAKSRKRSELQPPFRPQDLLSVDQFIPHCQERGITTSKRQLEYYDRKNLLLPAVRVNLGFVEYRRILIKVDGRKVWQFASPDDVQAIEYEEIDQRPYYGHGTISSGSRDWLKRHDDRGLVEYPAGSRFRQWNRYKAKQRYATSLKALGKEYALFYSKDQIFPLRHIQESLVWQVRDAMLLADEEAWAQLGQRLRRAFAARHLPIQEQVLKYYETFSLLTDVLALLDQIWERANEEYKLSFRRHRRSKEAEADALFRWHEEEHGCASEARKILRESCLAKDEIEKRRKEFVDLGRSLDPTLRWFDYLDDIPGEALDRSTGQYKFVLECYRVAEQLRWLLERCGRKQPSLSALLNGGSDYRICPYCEDYFEVGNVRQKTCLKSECIKDHKNALKRRYRRLGV